MTFHITGEEDNSKNFVHDIPPELLPTIARFATRCTDLYRSDDPTADFADVENKLFAMTMETGKEVIGRIAEKRDDGVGSIRRDGKSWYRIPPTVFTHLFFEYVLAF